MSQSNFDPNQKFRLGQSPPSDRNIPTDGKQPGGIVTNIKEINWTPQKLALTVALLTIPYIGVVFACFLAGFSFIGYFLIGIAILFVVLVILLRFIDAQDF